MRITVIGTGYVGLVAGACFANTGNDVVCVDRDAGKVERLLRGEIPIYEPGLDLLVKRNAEAGRLAFTTDGAGAMKRAEVIVIAVGTPQGDDGAADLSQVWAVCEEIGQAIDGYRVVVMKSTVPVGTADGIRARIGARTKHPFDVVSNPEFLKEGDAVNDFLKPDRVVIGTDSARAETIMRRLYAPFNRSNDRLLVMDNRSAEMTKYAANCFLATKVSFMNEMANLCERLGADVGKVRVGIGSDSRIGYKFIFPGVGYGGSCFPKDVSALVHMGDSVGFDAAIVKSVQDVNARQKHVLADKILAHFAKAGKTGTPGAPATEGGKPLAGRTVAVWGLAFKPNTDDMREAPALTIIARLLEAGAKVAAYDPEAAGEARKHLGDSIRYAKDPYDALEGACALAVVTEWDLFRNPDFDRIRALLSPACAGAPPAVFDGRNLYTAMDLPALGFAYHSIGRRPQGV